MLSKKMRITEQMAVTVLNGPSNYRKKLGPVPAGVKIKDKLNKGDMFIHLFVQNKKELNRYFPKVSAAMGEGGLLCISYPKASSRIQTDLTRDHGWEILADATLQWLSLISFDEKWSAFLMKNSLPKEQSKGSKEYHQKKQEWSDAKTKTVKIPDDLAAAFKKNKKAQTTFNALSFTGRKEYVMWIVSAKREETRAGRVKQTLAKLLEGKKTPMQK